MVNGLNKKSPNALARPGLVNSDFIICQSLKSARSETHQATWRITRLVVMVVFMLLKDAFRESIVYFLIGKEIIFHFILYVKYKSE